MKPAALSMTAKILRMFLKRLLTQIILQKVKFISIVKWPMVSFLTL